jgi:hypothetical protein
MVCGRYMIESVKSYILLQAPREMDFFFYITSRRLASLMQNDRLRQTLFLFPLKKKIIEKKKTQFIYADYRFKCVVV